MNTRMGTERVVVVGAGMVGHRFVEELVARDHEERYEIHLVGEEEYEPYNRILLTDVLARRAELATLTLPAPPPRVHVHRGVAATALDRGAGELRLADGRRLRWDRLVLATGARAFVPPVDGLGEDAPRHVHVLRTVDDCREVLARTVNARHAVVLGGGVLGLEAACALARRGLAVTVVHLDGHLMAESLDSPAAGVLAERLDDLGVRVHTGTSVAEVVGAYGELVAVRLTDGSVLATDLMLVSCGVRPRVELAAEAGLSTSRGVVVGADLTSPDDARVHAVGDCAEGPDGCTGLLAPGWDQATRLARQLAREAPPAAPAGRGVPEGVRLKAAGVDLVTRGLRQSDAAAEDRVVTLSDPLGRRHLEVVVRGDRLAGFTALGSPEVAASLSVAFERRTPLPNDPAALLVPDPARADRPEASPTLIPAEATICRCNGVTKADIQHAWHDGARSVDDVVAATRASTGCGGCADAVCGLVDWLTRSDAGTESNAQHARNTGGSRVSSAKQHASTPEIQRS